MFIANISKSIWKKNDLNLENLLNNVLKNISENVSKKFPNNFFKIPWKCFDKHPQKRIETFKKLF